MDKSPAATISEIKAELRLYMNGAASRAMRERGLDYRLNFGVELPRLREIASHYPKDHQLAQALWKEEVRESKILAAMLQPVDSFLPEIADIWVESIRNIEIADLTSMNLFQFLPYAPAKAFQWMADEREYVAVCGFRTAGRLLMKRGDMDERSANELIDQAISAFLSGTFHVRNAALSTLCIYMRGSEEHAFDVCLRVRPMKNSAIEAERLLFQAIEAELDA